MGLRKVCVFLGSLTVLLLSGGVRECWLLSEHVGYGEDFVKELELLLGDLAVAVCDRLSIEFLQALEAVDDEASEGARKEDLVIVDRKGAKSTQAFQLREKDERCEVVVLEMESSEASEALELVQVHMVHEQVEPHVVEVHLIHLTVELTPP